MATEMKKFHFVEYFVKELGCDINSFVEETGESILYIAVHNNDLQLVCWLLENNADIYNQAKDGTNALYVALKNHYYDILDQLLSFGEYLKIGNIDKYKSSELIASLHQDKKEFKNFITNEKYGQNLFIQLQTLKIFSDFYDEQEKEKINSITQEFKNGCKLMTTLLDGFTEFYGEIENSFNHVLDVFPNSAAVYNNLFILKLHQKHMEEALGLIEKAIELSPKNLIYSTNKAAFYLKNGDIQTAAELMFTIAKDYYNGKLFELDFHDLIDVNSNISDATSKGFREQLFTRIKNIVNIVEEEDQVSVALKGKVHETAVQFIKEALSYLIKSDQDLSDSASVIDAMHEFDTKGDCGGIIRLGESDLIDVDSDSSASDVESLGQDPETSGWMCNLL